jgi:hypothetical protein
MSLFKRATGSRGDSHGGSHGGTPVTLEFRHDADGDEAPHRDLSAVVQIGRDLWLGADEGTTLERLSPVGPDRYGEHATITLHDALDLPDAHDQEIDVEALASADGWLWVVGSHSAKRKKPRPDDAVDDQLARLARVERGGNRHLLARFPLVPERDGATGVAGANGTAPASPPDGAADGAPVAGATAGEAPTGVDVIGADALGSWTLAREAPALVAGNPERRAARLRAGRKGGALAEALAEDAHLAPFLGIPSKENGFDVEGLAVGGGARVARAARAGAARIRGDPRPHPEARR